MGRRGPPNKPTAVAKAEGRQASKLPKNEPIPPDGRPRCPKWLSAAAKTEWKRLAPILDGMGVLTIADASTLARYCDSFTRWKSSIMVLAEKGQVFEGRARPEVKVARELAEEMRKLEHYFGMTPASRASLSVDKSRLKGAEESIEAFAARNPRLKIANGSA